VIDQPLERPEELFALGAGEDRQRILVDRLGGGRRLTDDGALSLGWMNASCARKDQIVAAMGDEVPELSDRR
jgi:hypothetical protein